MAEQRIDRLRDENAKLLALLLEVTNALQNMGDFWAYGMAKTEDAQATDEDAATVNRLSAAARLAVDRARVALAIAKGNS